MASTRASSGRPIGPCGVAVHGSQHLLGKLGEPATIGRANTDGSAVDHELRPHRPGRMRSAASRSTSGIAAVAAAPPGRRHHTARRPRSTAGPGKKLAKGKAKFTFTSSEAGSSFGCKLDGKKTAPAARPRPTAASSPAATSSRSGRPTPPATKTRRPPSAASGSPPARPGSRPLARSRPRRRARRGSRPRRWRRPPRRAGRRPSRAPPRARSRAAR